MIEEAWRFARLTVVQEAGIIALIERGVRVLTASGDSNQRCLQGGPCDRSWRVRSARLVGKLKAARDRKRAAGAKVEGRKSYAEIDARNFGGEMIALAKKLRRKSPKGGRRSLRTISTELAVAGFVSASGKPFAATAVARMLGELK